MFLSKITLTTTGLNLILVTNRTLWDCRFVSTYCDTDKCKTAEWTKVSSQCKSMLWKLTRCVGSDLLLSDLHTQRLLLQCITF